MSIKEKIGKRIKEERQAKGLTRKALAALTENLGISRINNYERGDRTPGPEEAKQLAKALEVSPAFLMCLSDDRQGKLKKSPGLGALIPVLDVKQACSPLQSLQKIKNEQYLDKVDLVPISARLSEHAGENAFALLIKDESMTPELRLNDVLVINPDVTPKPGDFVVVLIKGDDQAMVRKYKQLSASKSEPKFELIALNDDWPPIVSGKENRISILGVVISLMRYFVI